MSITFPNPFDNTKSSYFNDQEIFDYWVDFVEENGFRHLFQPSSSMPMIVLGGKGSGKTHLMRYFSYQIQKIHHKDKNILSGIREDGFLGIYFPCSALGYEGFRNKGLSEEKWSVLFPYHFDLSLALTTLHIINDLFFENPIPANIEGKICKEITNVFDSCNSFTTPPVTISDLCMVFEKLKRDVDFYANNCLFSDNLDEVVVSVTRGRLILDIPKIIATNINDLQGIKFLYSIDELEAFLPYQQKYLQTLIREQKEPCLFKIGTRLYGLRVEKTLSGETNLEGHEYCALRLDEHLRNDNHYKNFSLRICQKRLSKAGFNKTEQNSMKNLFQTCQHDFFENEITNFVLEKYKNKERPYFKKLRIKLSAPRFGLETEDIDKIINLLSRYEYPLIEKINIYLFYKNMIKDKITVNKLIESAHDIKSLCSDFIESKHKSRLHKSAYEHLKNDFIAQLYKECLMLQPYYGMDVLLRMSSGLPRNFLMILKNIYDRAIFNGETPFIKDLITFDSQKKGVNDASIWFLNDSLSDPYLTGTETTILRECIDRLARFFREIRFSDRPSECSLIAFSTNYGQISEVSKKNIRLLLDRSVLIEDKNGRLARNSKDIQWKCILNPMLSPKWDLPVSERGAIEFNKNEVNSIFDQEYTSKYQIHLDNRLSRMNVSNKKKTTSRQSSLFKSAI